MVLGKFFFSPVQIFYLFGFALLVAALVRLLFELHANRFYYSIKIANFIYRYMICHFRALLPSARPDREKYEAMLAKLKADGEYIGARAEARRKEDEERSQKEREAEETKIREESRPRTAAEVLKEGLEDLL